MSGGQLLAVSNTYSKGVIYNSVACYLKVCSKMEVLARYEFPF